MSAFIKYTNDLAALMEDGTDVSFYSGPDYAVIPNVLLGKLNPWALRQLGTKFVKSAGAESDGADFFVLKLDSREECDELTEMIRLELLLAMDVATVSLSMGSLDRPETDEHLEDVADIIALRTLIVSSLKRAKPSKKSTYAGALLIYVGED